MNFSVIISDLLEDYPVIKIPMAKSKPVTPTAKKPVSVTQPQYVAYACPVCGFNLGSTGKYQKHCPKCKSSFKEPKRVVFASDIEPKELPKHLEWPGKKDYSVGPSGKLIKFGKQEAKHTTPDDSHYLELAQDPETNAEKLQKMVDEKTNDPLKVRDGAWLHVTDSEMASFGCPNDDYARNMLLRAAILRLPNGPYLLKTTGRAAPSLKEKIEKLLGFTVDIGTLEKVVRGLAEKYPNSIKASLTLGLEEVRLANHRFDPVAYDNQGNIIPLSKRFATQEKDTQIETVINQLLDHRDIEKGDTILTGKWKNSPAVVKGFGKDVHNQPTVRTSKGEISLYKFRIKKLMDSLLETDLVNKEKFIELADQQRGEPEEAMVQAQLAMGGGVFCNPFMHANDLLHRMTERPTFDSAGYEYVLDKINKISNSLNYDYPFEKEMMENFKHNAKAEGIHVGVFMKKVKDRLKIFTDAYNKLPTYNEAQQTAKELALAMGFMQFNKARVLVRKLRKHLGSKQEWVTYAHANLLEV